MASSSTIKRLHRELAEYQSSSNEAILHLNPISDDDLLHWEAVLKGVPNTPYEDGLWSLKISIPSTYPLSPPTITFTTPICHPNISFTTGEICLTLLTTEHWTPAYTLSSTLLAIHQLLTDPQPDSPLNVDIAALLRAGDLLGWESLVRYWTAEERWNGYEKVKLRA
ncbi:hypothetical protein LOZ58_005280 [Ophidiomyces ophidiicola]|nr:hypothetical protein LOZ65_000107 [Ophidiomyces ophidiicola]KAI1934448.1 hypothetical protein LOZ66_005916 [Ophidiomyces ophidiicola]KAI1958165.1 hypothetical protein LOZ58_005280 [Ophidiomyces ophidiicola]